MTASLRLADPLLEELDHEAPATRRVLERVPGNRLGWKPHVKSRSIGELAMHVARLPQVTTGFVSADSFDVLAGGSRPPQTPVESVEALLSTFDAGVSAARGYLQGLEDERARETWRLVAGSKEVFAGPRVTALRRLFLNHWYHHRGQLTVYLRLLDVPVPAVYGATADEMPL